MGKASINTLVRLNPCQRSCFPRDVHLRTHTAEGRAKLVAQRQQERSCDWMFAHGDTKSIHRGVNVFTAEK